MTAGLSPPHAVAPVPAIGPLDDDRITAFIPGFDREDRVYQGTAGEGVAVDAGGNVYGRKGRIRCPRRAFTKYSEVTLRVRRLVRCRRTRPCCR